MLYKHGIKDINRYELIRLWQIPEVKEMLVSQIQKILVGEGGKVFEKFQQSRADWFRELYEKPAENGEKGSIYWFELTRYKEGNWKIIDIGPKLPVNVQPYEIVTGVIIEEMSQYPVRPEESFTLNKTNPLGETAVIRFVRHSTTSILGTISFFANPDKSATHQKNDQKPNETKNKAGDFQVIVSTGNEEMQFRNFNHFLYRDFEEGKRFMRDFLLQRLPQVLNSQEQGKEE